MIPMHNPDSNPHWPHRKTLNHYKWWIRRNLSTVSFLLQMRNLFL